MLKHSIAYSLRLLILFLAGMGFLGWLYVGKLKNLDSLESLNQAMGLSKNWNDRVLLLEKRYPWAEGNSTSWKAHDLDSFLKVKSELMPALREWRERYPEWTGDSTSRGLPSPEGMLAEVLRIRVVLLEALERQHISLSAYRFFNVLVGDMVHRGSGWAEQYRLTPEQREWLQERQVQLKELDTSGVEYLGLPH